MDKKNPKPNVTSRTEKADSASKSNSGNAEITKAFSKAAKAMDKNKDIWYEGAD
ncbi:MAG: hypothetical protein K8F91_20590 [Candidatus Obscuribacterales bacterium]|nr:hypothetical protein [Candidatus Obscuribacterales bacterium]